MDQVHREDLAHLKTNIGPRHYRDPRQYYGESFLTTIPQKWLAVCYRCRLFYRCRISLDADGECGRRSQ